jgi:hypothetical protein
MWGVGVLGVGLILLQLTFAIDVESEFFVAGVTDRNLKFYVGEVFV